MKRLGRPTTTIVLLLLGASAATACSRADGPPRKNPNVPKDAFVIRTLVEADAGRALNVASNPHVQFDEGFSLLSFDPPEDFHNHAFRWMGQHAHVRLKTPKGQRMRLAAMGWVNPTLVRSKAVVQLVVDGVFVGEGMVNDKGEFAVETVVAPEHLRRPWVDLVIRTSAIGFDWLAPPELKTAVLYGFDWRPAR